MYVPLHGSSPKCLKDRQDGGTINSHLYVPFLSFFVSIVGIYFSCDRRRRIIAPEGDETVVGPSSSILEEQEVGS
jgi:hypothetical protein